LYLVISLAEELELLGLLVHEDPVQVTRLHRPDLDGLSIREIVEPTKKIMLPLPPSYRKVGKSVVQLLRFRIWIRWIRNETGSFQDPDP
jgi:hypothetical protein